MKLSKYEDSFGTLTTTDMCVKRVSHHPHCRINRQEIVIDGDVGIKTWAKIDYLCHKGYYVTYK